MQIKHLLTSSLIVMAVVSTAVIAFDKPANASNKSHYAKVMPKKLRGTWYQNIAGTKNFNKLKVTKHSIKWYLNGNSKKNIVADYDTNHTVIDKWHDKKLQGYSFQGYYKGQVDGDPYDVTFGGKGHNKWVNPDIRGDVMAQTKQVTRYYHQKRMR